MGTRTLATDVLLDPFDVGWTEFLAAAEAARAAGFDGIWTWDHLAGQVHQARSVLECWTALSALASRIPDIAVGPLVLNVANRDPRMLAAMAATLQAVAGGRLLLGLGAGGGQDTPYAGEQRALGRAVAADAVRRRHVAEAVQVMRQLWTGQSQASAEPSLYPLGTGRGFLRPDPPPP
ncbi:MAG TPA: LLM class flavin-dependent oxidoreductase, partial [Chloroflexota bacterium]